MNEKDEMYLYWLLNVPGIGKKKAKRLLEIAGSAQAVYQEGGHLWEMVDLLSSKDKQALQVALSQNVQERYQSLQRRNIRFLSIVNREYPERLRKIPDPPFVLYVRGKVPDEQRPSVAIIGAREGSAYGMYVAGELGKRLAVEGIQVISGLARGIDCEAQKAAVMAGGGVFGVLGCGVDICYPRENHKLYETLSIKGGVISEYAPGTEPKASLFPPRNRIISGLADVVVVVEAKEKSGTLITVDMALEQGKEVYVVPGRVTDPMSVGCNRLMKQGAGILYRLDEFVEEVWMIWQRRRKDVRSGEINNKWENGDYVNEIKSNVKTEKEKMNMEQEMWGKQNTDCRLGQMEEKIVKLLDIKPLTMQQLYSQLTISEELTIAELSELLFEMENMYIIYKKDLLYFLNIKKI